MAPKKVNFQARIVTPSHLWPGSLLRPINILRSIIIVSTSMIIGMMNIGQIYHGRLPNPHPNPNMKAKARKLKFLPFLIKSRLEP